MVSAEWVARSISPHANAREDYGLRLLTLFANFHVAGLRLEMFHNVRFRRQQGVCFSAGRTGRSDYYHELKVPGAGALTDKL